MEVFFVWGLLKLLICAKCYVFVFEHFIEFNQFFLYLTLWYYLFLFRDSFLGMYLWIDCLIFKISLCLLKKSVLKKLIISTLTPLYLIVLFSAKLFFVPDSFIFHTENIGIKPFLMNLHWLLYFIMLLQLLSYLLHTNIFPFDIPLILLLFR